MMMIRHLLLSLLVIFPIGSLAAEPAEPYAAWIQAMQDGERGPFERLRWFCADGSVLPPRPYACRDHGGGRQHGEYTQRTQKIRQAGFYIANLLAATEPGTALADDAERLKWILVERFLIEADDGWIFRRARFYRGAVQAEDESAGARAILERMTREPRYLDSRFLLLREAARLLPWQGDTPAHVEVRGLASTLAELDPGFATLRNKLHGSPEPADIAAVKAYAERVTDPGTRQKLNALEAALQRVFAVGQLDAGLRGLAGRLAQPGTAARLQALASQWSKAQTPEAQLAVAARALAALREALAETAPAQRLAMLATSLDAEQAAFAAGRRLLASASEQSRAWRLARIRDNLDALYGLGLLTARERSALQQRLAALPERPTIADYRDALDYLARAPAWADARLGFHFGPVVARLARIEPKAHGLAPDRLRGSPMLLHGQLLDPLLLDGDRLAGVRHELFGRTVGLGLRALNPGLARGPVQALEALAPAAGAAPIVLAADTAADLPAVAGILTAREGNSLSHVQLLARNLGIPNVVVGAELMPEIEGRIGQRAVLLASRGGVVRLAADSSDWDAVFGDDSQPDRPAVIRVDIDKLDLGRTDLVALSQLRTADSGRVVGPKAAKLGELKALFPDRVSPGLAIPFGVFRDMLARPHPGGGTWFDWMRDSYIRLQGIDDPASRTRQTSAFLAELRAAIEAYEFEPAFEEQLRRRMGETFGEDGSYGVFVRSDTNVEDLPGFTGAGLNLTVPNVVGFDAVLSAIKQVWASPFTERAFGWRQALMDRPEHVYAAVLLHRSVPADASGVMITADLATGARDVLSIAVNEGVAGGVDGQAAESLRVALDASDVRLLASAAEPYRRILPASGGVARVPASGAPRVLSEAQIDALRTLAQALPSRYPALLDAEGRPAPADVEFAFVGDRLYLLQIRPFLQSTKAQRSRVLAALDAELAGSASRRLDLATPPAQATP